MVRVMPLRNRWAVMSAAAVSVTIVPILELARLSLLPIMTVQLISATLFLINATPQWWRESVFVTALAVVDALRIAYQRPRNIITGILITVFSAHITEHFVVHALSLVSPGAEAVGIPSVRWKQLKLYLQGRGRGPGRGSSPPLLANGVASLYLEAVAVVIALAVAMVAWVMFFSEGLLQAPGWGKATFDAGETADAALHSGLALVAALASVCSAENAATSYRCVSALDAAVEACRDSIETVSGLRLASVSYTPTAEYDWAWSAGVGIAGEDSSDMVSYTVGHVEAKAVWLSATTMAANSGDAPASSGAVEGLAAVLLCIAAFTLAALSSARSVQRGVGGPVMSLLGLIDDYDSTLVRNAWTAFLHERTHPQHQRSHHHHHHRNNILSRPSGMGKKRFRALSKAVMSLSTSYESARLETTSAFDSQHEQRHGGGSASFPPPPQPSPNPAMRRCCTATKFVWLLICRCWGMLVPLWLQQLMAADAELLWRHREKGQYRRGASPAVGAHHAVIYRQQQGTLVPAGGGSGQPVAVAESEALEAVVAHLVALQRMKQEHYDVRHSTHIERGQFVDPKVSDWINTAFMHGHSKLLLEEGGVDQGGAPVPTPLVGDLSRGALALDDSPLLAVIDKLRRREKEAEKARRRRALVKATRRSTQHPLMEGGSSSGGGRLQAQHKASRVHPVASSVSAEGHGSDRPRRRVRAKRSWSSPPLGRATSVPLALGPGSRGAGNSEVVVLGSNDLRMISLTALSEDNLCSSSSGTGDGEQRWEKTFGGERISVLESVVESSHLPATSSLSPLSEPTNIRIPSLSPHPIDSVKFDVLQIPTIPHLAHGVRVVFEASGLVDRFQVSQKVLSSFVASVIDGYLPQAPESAGGGPRYHNAFHGADVLHTVWRFQLLIGAQHLFGPAERFGQLIAAFGHDLGHPGLNNPYLIASQHAAARLFHDDSPLENMHCAELFRVLNGRPRGKVLQGLHAQHKGAAASSGGDSGGGGRSGRSDSDVFARMTVAEKASVRRVVVKCILSTDMAYHFQQVNDLSSLLSGKATNSKGYYRALADLPRHGRFGQSPSPALSFLKDYGTRVQVLEFLVHLADISNPLKPYHIYMAWTDRIVEEFCAQGDRERAEGTPISPMCDRESVNLVNMQIGFMEFVVAPFVSKVVGLFPALVTHGLYMHGNYSKFVLRKLGGDTNAAKKHAGRKRLGQTIFDAAFPAVFASPPSPWAAPPSVWSSAADARGAARRSSAAVVSSGPLPPPFRT